jgi:DNA-binding response OmpR family regulator
MALDPSSRARFNLSNTAVLLFDPTPMGMAILVQIIAGLGAKNLYRCETIAEAKEVVTHFEVDLMILDAVAGSGEGYEFVRWLRREVVAPNKHTPVLLTTGHTMISDVSKGRDCGGHFIISKPIAPIVMLERIVWIAKEGRAFLFSDNYVGPDRRFSEEGRPGGLPGRRREDLLRLAEADAVAGDGPSSAVESPNEPFVVLSRIAS